MSRRPSVPTRRANTKAPQPRVTRPMPQVRPVHRKLPPQRGR